MGKLWGLEGWFVVFLVIWIYMDWFSDVVVGLENIFREVKGFSVIYIFFESKGFNLVVRSIFDFGF